MIATSPTHPESLRAYFSGFNAEQGIPMHCGINQLKYIRSATNRRLDSKRFRTKDARFQKLTIQSGERYFYLFCTKDSLEHRRDEIIQWADQLARQLCWQFYETTISTASISEATERMHALFEYGSPVKSWRS